MATNNENDNTGKIPKDNPSKAMDSKREVENANDNKIDQDFPGYPHYPSKEDIMDQRTDSHRVDVDVQNFAAGPNASGINQRFVAENDRQNEMNDATSEQNENTQRQDELADNQQEIHRSIDDDLLNDGRNEEIGIPQNVSNQDMNSDLPGTDLNEASDNTKR
jgi:hypothetical protein